MTIAADMQERLDNVFTAELHATVVSVQIAECSLPQMFNDAVTHTVTQRQNITAAQKYLDSERVSLATELLVARRNANATLAAARGTASAALLAANAMAAVATTQGVYEARAWSEAMATLNLSTAQMLEYIWWGEVGDEGGQPRAAAPADLLVGVRPSTLSEAQRPRERRKPPRSTGDVQENLLSTSGVHLQSPFYHTRGTCYLRRRRVLPELSPLLRWESWPSSSPMASVTPSDDGPASAGRAVPAHRAAVLLVSPRRERRPHVKTRARRAASHARVSSSAFFSSSTAACTARSQAERASELSSSDRAVV